jgi:hypothetical protein
LHQRADLRGSECAYRFCRRDLRHPLHFVHEVVAHFSSDPPPSTQTVSLCTKRDYVRVSPLLGLVLHSTYSTPSDARYAEGSIRSHPGSSSTSLIVRDHGGQVLAYVYFGGSRGGARRPSAHPRRGLANRREHRQAAAGAAEATGLYRPTSAMTSTRHFAGLRSLTS